MNYLRPDCSYNIRIYYLTILLVIGLNACKQTPVSDTDLFSYRNNPSTELERYIDTAKMTVLIQEIPQKSHQVDSLLIMSDQLKNYDANISLYYANQAYNLATEESWDLQRAISLYYIAFAKPQLQDWGGGIEDALVDAEISRSLFARLNRQDWMIRVYDLIGNIHLHQYEEDRPLKLDTAKAYFYRALHTLKISNLARADSINLNAEILYSLGSSFYFEHQDTTMILYHAALKDFEAVDNKSSGFRVKDDIATLLITQLKLDSAEQLLNGCLAYAIESKEKNLLGQVYLHLSDLKIQQYKINKSEEYFKTAIALLNKRLTIQTVDAYNTYQRVGYAHNQKAFILYREFLRKDSSQFYYDWAYQEVDSTLSYYKLAMDDARTKGVLNVMDNLMLNIYDICIDKITEKQGDSASIFGQNPAKYLRESYKKVADLMTLNLTNANQRIRQMERLESDRQSASKRRQLLIFSGVALLITALIFLLFLQQAKQRKLSAQMEALRAQINPHFISNSLNAIESLVNLGKNKAASKYLIHFSRLSRRILNSSRNPNTNLAHELQTLEHFMKLEQLRFRDKLNYQIELSSDLDANLVEVPAMILQPYIENAIWHGIKPKTSPGMLQIKIERNGKHLICILEDDGIGRKKAREIQDNSMLKHKSHGMKITEERLDAIGKIKGAKVEIIDLHNIQGHAIGTRVIVRLPFKLMKQKQPKD